MDFNNKAERQKKTTLTDLSKRSWREYGQRISELSPLISRIAKDFNFIRERQKHYRLGLSSELEQLPRGGDFQERLDPVAHQRYCEKVMGGEPIELKDTLRWRMDKIVADPTTVELWILTDGSPTITYEIRKGDGPRLNAALQITAALRQAGKRAGFDTFAGLTGGSKIRMLASPGDSDQEVGEKFEEFRSKFPVSGSDLSPAIKEAIEHSARQNSTKQGKNKLFAGMTHFLIIGDGGLDDKDALVQTLTTLFRQGPAVSVDIAILSSVERTEMHELVDAVKKIIPSAAIGIVRSDNANEIPLLLANRLKDRFAKSMKGVQGIPDRVKRDKFLKVARLLNQP